MVRVDINENGLIDAKVDTYYGASHGSPCVGFLLSETGTTQCGGFRSGATLSVVDGRNQDQKQFIWIIPKSELGNRSSGASVAVSTYNLKTGQWFYFADFHRPYKLNYAPRPPR
jgi:hypothetical protein